MNIRFVGGVIAVALIAGGYLLMDRTYDAGKLPDHAPEMVDAQLQNGPAEAYRIMKAGFPDDYAALVAELSDALEAEAGQAELARITQQAVTDLRQTHADALLSAPDARLRAVLTGSRDLHAAVRADEGREVCNRFSIGGPGALGPALERYLEVLEGQGSAVLNAIAEGRSAEATPHTPVVAEDWDAAHERALSNGADPAHLEALRELDQETGDICAGLVSLLDAILGMDDSLGARLRASYVRDLARN